MALGSLKSRARSPIVSEINITPLTDIFLVLLIIFMVTSAAMVQSGAQITLPEVESTAAKPKDLTITVTPENDIYINATLTPYEEIETVLRGYLTNKPDLPVVLEGDREVLFGNAVKILSIAQKAGAVVVGTNGIRDLLQRDGVALVILAADRGPRTEEKVGRLARGRAVPVLEGPVAAELGRLVGRAAVQAVGITNPRLAAGFLAAQPGQHTSTVEALGDKHADP